MQACTPGSGMGFRNRTLATVQSGAFPLRSHECVKIMSKFIGSSYILGIQRPLNNVGVRGADPPRSGKSTCNFIVSRPYSRYYIQGSCDTVVCI